MFDTVLGLPVHPLVVHATVVVLPAAALSVAMAALWPSFRSRAGAVPLVLSIAALALVPISVQSGGNLAERVDESALVETHQSLGEDLLPWVIALAAAAAALFWLRWDQRRRDPGDRRAPYRLMVAGIVVAALVGASGTTVQVVRVGHSGSEAAWSDVTVEDG